MPDAAAEEEGPDGFCPIARVWSLPEAAVLLATLGAYGILALPRNHGHVSTVPTLMVALGGVWITVPREQVADALALMAEIDSGWHRPPPPFAPEPWLSRAVSLFLAVMTGVPPMPGARGSYRWRSGQADAST